MNKLVWVMLVASMFLWCWNKNKKYIIEDLTSKNIYTIFSVKNFEKWDTVFIKSFEDFKDNNWNLLYDKEYDYIYGRKQIIDINWENIIDTISLWSNIRNRKRWRAFINSTTTIWKWIIK